MTWSETHRRYEALRAIESDLDHRADATVAWQPHYAELFGTPAQLALLLRTRWETMVDAQVESCYDEFGHPSAELRELAAAHPGLIRAIVATDPSGSLRPLVSGPLAATAA